MTWSYELLDELETDLNGRVPRIERVVKHSLWVGSWTSMYRISVEEDGMTVLVSQGSDLWTFDLNAPNCLESVVNLVVKLTPKRQS